MMKKPLELPAIRDKDLTHILSELGVLDKFEEQKVNCVCCGLPLGWNNLGAITVSDSNLLFVCDSTSCLDEISRGIHKWVKT